MTAILRKVTFLILCIVIVVTAIIFIVSCSTKVVVHKIGNQKLEQEGPFYSLPINVLQLQLLVSKITQKPGKFWMCSDLLSLLDYDSKTIENIKNGNKEIYESPDQKIVVLKISDPQFSTIAVPDPTNTYLIDVKGGFFNQQDITVKLNELGNITSLDATTTDKSLEFALTFLETAASFAPFFLYVEPSKVPMTTPQCTSDLQKIALEVVNEILDLREAKKKLITGMSGPITTKETLDSMITEINKMENELLEKNFKGINSKIEWKPLFEYTPKTNNEQVLLYSITMNNCIRIPVKDPGVNLADNIDEIDVTEEINKDCPNNDGIKENITLSISVPNNYQENVKLEKIKSVIYEPDEQQEQGIAYRIPARAKIELIRKEALPRTKPKVIAITKPQIAQLGIEATLPAKLGYGKTGYSLEFYDNTGSLKKIGASSDTIQPSTISRTGAAGKSIVESIESRDIEKLKQKNEKTQLEINEIKLDTELKSLKSGN